MTATALQTLNEGDYQKFRVPADLGSFGSLSTSAGMLPLQSMTLQGHVLGLLYQLKLVQRFYNPYGQPLEAIYIFPLPGRAAVSSFVMQTQSRRVVGKLEERGEARRQYQQAVAQGKQAALAEEERSEVFTMTVGNIPPGEFVEIELELHGPLTWSDGQAMFRFPLVVAPRYIPGTPYPGDSVGSGIQGDTDAVPDASRISPPVLLPGYPNPVHLSVDILVDQGGLQFGPPTVSLADLLCYHEPGGFRLSLRPTADRLDRDLIVRIPLPSPQPQSSFQVAPGPEGHYFVLNLVPDNMHQLGPQTPRQVVTLLDRSGSMAGWKMVCARRAVGRLIDSLNDRDAFQVLNFDDSVEYLDPGKKGLRYATDRERYLALEQLGNVKDRGGTEILKAIQAGVNLVRGQQQPMLILITDGQVGNESEVLRWIQQNAAGIRIFTVGIDTAVNVSLLERIAQVSGGHFTLVNSEEQLDQEMLGLRRRINPPLLSKVSVNVPGAECSPVQVDLFEGLCARQMGFLRGAVPPELEVVGYAQDGRAFRNRLPVSYCTGETIQKIWARERVLELEHGFLAGWRQPAYQPAAIAQFALQHGVLCRFTAFVAVDDQSYVPGTLHTVTQAVSEPAGWEQPKPKLQARAGYMKAKRESAVPMMSKPSLGRAQAPGAPSPAAPPARRAGPVGNQRKDLLDTWDEVMAAPCMEPAPCPPAVAGFGGGGDSFAGPCDDLLAEPCAQVCFEAAPAARDTRLLLRQAPQSDDLFADEALKERCETESQKKKAESSWQPATPAPAPPPPPPAVPLAVQEALDLLRQAQSVAEWDQALQLLMEVLVRQGFTLARLEVLMRLHQSLSGRLGPVSTHEADQWRQQVETLLHQLLPQTRQNSFWL